MTLLPVGRRFVQGAYRFAQSWWAIFVIFLLVCGFVLQRWEFTHPKLLSPPRIGDVLASVEVADLQGRAVTLPLPVDARPTVVYVFSPECTWCAKNVSAVRNLILQSRDFRVIGISTTSKNLTRYLADHSLTMPTYVFRGATTNNTLRTAGTPTTILISQSGVVSKVWVGTWSGARGKEIELALNARLTGPSQ